MTTADEITVDGSVVRRLHKYTDYGITSDGRLYRITPRNVRYRWEAKSRWLKPLRAVNGYIRYCVDGKNGKFEYAHRLVAMAWLPPPQPDQTDVAHLNSVRDDNRSENLKWATRAENLSHKKAHGTELLGERANGAVLTPNKVREIRRRYQPGVFGYIRLAKAYGVSHSTIAAIIQRRSWRHIGDENQEAGPQEARFSEPPVIPLQNRRGGMVDAT